MIGPQFSAVARVLHVAAALQQTHVAPAPAPADSVVVESPLPRGAAEVARFLLNAVPPWVQVGGVVVGAAVGVFVLRFLFVRRRTIRQWFVSRSVAVRVAIAVAAVVIFAGAGGVGAATWNFTQHEGTPEGDYAGVRQSRPPPAEADRFPHARHAKLACLACHETGAGHGRLTFEPPRGCAICHHQAPTRARCASCHRTEKYAAPKHATVTVTVPGRQPDPRPVDFLHARHITRTCVECHATPVTLALSPAKAQCKDCHSEHHAVGRNCSACHTIAEPKVEHRTLEAAHQRCDACHTATTIARLTPTRSFCSTCHAAKTKDHYDQQECSVCHFLAEPGVYRSKLVTPLPK